MKKFVLDINKVNDIKHILNNKTCYLTCSGRLDGVGAQTWAMISTMITAKYLGFTYIHTPFQNVDHNDLNFPSKRWNQTWDNLFKIDRCYMNINDWNQLSQKGNKVLLDWKQLFSKSVEHVNKLLKSGNCYIVKESHDFINTFHGEMGTIIQDVISNLKKAFHDKSITAQIPKYMMPSSKPVINIKFKNKIQQSCSSKGRPPTVVNKTIVKPPINLAWNKKDSSKQFFDQSKKDKPVKSHIKPPVKHTAIQPKPMNFKNKQIQHSKQEIQQTILQNKLSPTITDKIIVTLANKKNLEIPICSQLPIDNIVKSENIVIVDVINKNNVVGDSVNENNVVVCDVVNENNVVVGDVVNKNNVVVSDVVNKNNVIITENNVIENNEDIDGVITENNVGVTEGGVVVGNLIGNIVEEARETTKKGNSKTNCLYYRKDKIDIAVHVRKGDVIEWNITTRITPNEYFINVIKQLYNVFGDKARIHIFSEGTIQSDFPELEKIQNTDVDINYFIGEHNDKITNCDYNLATLKDKDDTFKDLILNMHLNGDARTAFSHLVSADILVTCKSCFSYVAAILNENGTVLFSEFWFPSLSNSWITLNKDGSIPQSHFPITFPIKC